MRIRINLKPWWRSLMKIEKWIFSLWMVNEIYMFTTPIWLGNWWCFWVATVLLVIVCLTHWYVYQLKQVFLEQERLRKEIIKSYEEERKLYKELFKSMEKALDLAIDDKETKPSL